MFNLPTISEADFDITRSLKGYKDNSEMKSALLRPNNIAPAWSSVDIDGKKTSLSTLKGKIILMDFFLLDAFGLKDSQAGKKRGLEQENCSVDISVTICSYLINEL